MADAPRHAVSGALVVGADAEAVGYVVAAAAGYLLIELAGSAGPQVIRVPWDLVAGTGDAILLTTTRGELETTERDRAELIDRLREAHLTPSQVRALRAFLDRPPGCRSAPDAPIDPAQGAGRPRGGSSGS